MSNMKQLASMESRGGVWEHRARRCLRLEMARAGVKCPELARRLSRSGQAVTAQALRNKLARGSFSAAFLLAALDALACQGVRLSDIAAPSDGDERS